MKKRRVILGLSILAAVAFLTGASKPKSWDNTPADQSAVLYYEEQITIDKLDGEGKGGGVVAFVYPGKGSAKKPQASLRIPAGEHTLSVRFQKYEYAEIGGNFAPGGHYEIKCEHDPSLVEKTGAGIGGMFAAAALGGDMTKAGYKFLVVDITDQKVKKKK